LNKSIRADYGRGLTGVLMADGLMADGPWLTVHG
jgi:hypothetical protein